MSMPPTYDEVERFAHKRRSPVDPKRFWAHYDANGWKRSNGLPIVKWIPLFLSWELDERYDHHPDPERFRERDAEHARFVLVRKLRVTDARNWDDDKCLAELAALQQNAT